VRAAYAIECMDTKEASRCPQQVHPQPVQPPIAQPRALATSVPGSSTSDLLVQRWWQTSTDIHTHQHLDSAGLNTRLATRMHDHPGMVVTRFDAHFAMARPSLPMAAPMAENREVLKEAAVVMTWGKDVAAGVGPPKCTPSLKAIPCKPSDHH
jgi:hypothetical protein